jgi:hypothetical protein
VSGAPSVAITSANPPYATAGQQVTVQGSVTNSTGDAITGVTIQLRSSSVPFLNRDQLQQYADGDDPTADSPVQGAVTTIPGTVQPGATVKWTAVLPVKEVHMSSFGVYPLAAQAVDATGTAIATSWTFLPYWPAASGAARPKRDDIAWLWPLIDTPDQGACPGLLDDHLSRSLTGDGRLAGLVTAGSSAAGQAAHLTWVMDPALLSSAQIMTRPYQAGANRNCRKAAARPTSQAAVTWLAALRSAISGQSAFVTPYADVDMAALTRQNLGGDLHQAFDDGRSVGAAALGRSFQPTTTPAGHQSAAQLISAAAWPADGLANYSMLENLAAVNGIRTVVLSSSAMPPLSQPNYTPSAVTSTPDGEGGDMRVLLSDATLTQVLGSVSARSDPRGATFAANQRFLAETAMIAAQAPGLRRAIVVAPPRDWDPPAGFASGLLNDTISAPWLSPVSAGSLAADKNATGQVERQAPSDVGSQVLKHALLHRVKAIDADVQQVKSMQVRPNPQLNRAIAGIESSAWRGSEAGRKQARSMLRGVAAYISRQENGVSIIGPGRVTLGGLKGAVPVSIDNRLDYPVRVRVRWTVKQKADGGFIVRSRLGVITVPANIVVTRKLKVQAAAIGSTTINLRLLTPAGGPLPGRAVTMTVQATHFGTLALIVLAAALGVFMITSATRGIRRGRTLPGHGDPDPADQDAPAVSDAGGHEQPDRADNVVPDRAESGEAGTDHVPTEDADDYARVPGWADRS